MRRLLDAVHFYSARFLNGTAAGAALLRLCGRCCVTCSCRFAFSARNGRRCGNSTLPHSGLSLGIVAVGGCDVADGAGAGGGARVWFHFDGRVFVHGDVLGVCVSVVHNSDVAPGTFVVDKKGPKFARRAAPKVNTDPKQITKAEGGGGGRCETK